MGAQLSSNFVESLVGPLAIDISEGYLVRVYPRNAQNTLSRSKKWSQLINRLLKNQISSRDIPFQLQGTEFQVQVWKQVMRIPYGQTETYQGIARLINREKAYRAVGQALNRNPLLLVVPCHRVISKTGQLTGFAGGIGMKKRLLEYEARVIEKA